MTNLETLAQKQSRATAHARALVKAVTWRVIGTIDTFIWAVFITHHPFAAAKIAGTETFTKIFLFYIHERLWRLFRWAPNSHARSLIKAFTWRVIGSMDTFVLSLIFTGKLTDAFSIAGGEAISKIILYYVHERVWRRVRWGRLEEAAQAAAAPA